MARSTTISLSKKNHLKLMRIGKKGQSFDVILTELLEKISQEPLQTTRRAGVSDGRSAVTKLSTQSIEMVGADEKHKEISR